jgi:hypothetical protein
MIEHGTQHFEALGVYNEIERVCKSTRSCTTFESCLQFVTNLVDANESLASSSPRITAFVDTVMRRVVHHLKSVSSILSYAG